MNLLEVLVGDEIDFEFGGLDVPVVADFAGDSENAGTCEPGMSEEHIASPLGDDFVLDAGFENDGAEGDSGFNLQVFEREIDGGEGGEDGDDGVAEGFCPGVAIARRAGFREAGAAGTEDDVVGGDCFVAEANGFDFSAGGEDFGDGGVELDVDSGILEVGVEDADNIFGGLVDGEDAAVFAGVNLEAAFGEHVDDVFVCEPETRRPDEISFVFTEGFEDSVDGAVMGDVAFSAARD